MSPDHVPPAKESRCLHWIGALQLAKGLLLVALALGLLSCLHKDVDDLVSHWMWKVGINIESRWAASLLETLDVVTDKQLFQLSIAAFCFAGVLVTQGTGLLCRQAWAKYLTLIATSALIPFEVFELAKGFGYGKLSVLFVNVAIVSLMLFLLRNSRKVPSAAADTRRPVRRLLVKV